MASLAFIALSTPPRVVRDRQPKHSPRPMLRSETILGDGFRRPVLARHRDAPPSSYPNNICDMSNHRLPERDRPWVMRTYAGHSDARRSNELYRRNLEKGQTGLSIAFDLPTQTGYDPDHELAKGEGGKVGVSIAHRGDMAALLDQIPLDQMNTSMTINATAAWLLALYIVAAEDQGVAEDELQGTTQNDILKEYLSRGTYAFPPGPSMR